VAVFDHQALATKFVNAMNSQDRAAFEALVTPDLIAEWPQSGERIRSFENYWAIMEGIPGGPTGNLVDTLKAKATDGVKLVAPSFTFVTVEGAGNSGTFTCRAKMPSGDRWVIALYSLRDGRIAKLTAFFAPMFEAPAWRAHLVERML
jgi:hypothetical protein